jgi:hypothetical protein
MEEGAPWLVAVSFFDWIGDGGKSDLVVVTQL